jgi:hypothetical protein
VIPSLTACSCDPSCGVIRRVVRNLPKRMTVHCGVLQSERCSASVVVLPLPLSEMPIRLVVLHQHQYRHDGIELFLIAARLKSAS